MQPREIFPDFELRLARAKKQDRENNAHLGEIANLFERKFGPLSPLDKTFIMGSSKGIGATIFFEKEADIARCEESGISDQMREFIYEKLEEFGRGKRGETTVVIEFDSFENVQKNYEGNYFLRMR